jgi:DNA-binding NtrC family response regulator
VLPEHAPTVLIVDDDNDMRLYCAKVLQSEGYATVSTSNASTVHQVLGRRPVDYFSPIIDLGHRPSDWRGALVPCPFSRGLA